MPAQNTVAQAKAPTVIRSVWLRLLPENNAVAYQLAGQTSGCHVNHII